MRAALRALAIAVLVFGLSASSCFKSADDVARGFVKAKSDRAVARGLTASDEMTRVTDLRVSTGAHLEEGARGLADDPQVQEAVFRVSWVATCNVIFGEVSTDFESVTQFVLSLAAEFGIAFLDGGAEDVAELVLSALDENPDDAEAKCNELRSTG